MSSPKKMLEAILKHAKLTPYEREMYEDMWDKCHRYGRLTRKQGAVIEKVYFAQKLDLGSRPKSEGQVATKPSKVAAFTYKGVTEEKCVTTLDQLSLICPDIKQGSKQYQKIADFFRKGGQVLKVKPPGS